MVTADNVSTGWLGGRRLHFDHGTEIRLMTVADPGYDFANWSGTMWSTADDLMFALDQDHDLRANFVATPAP
jgi:hypothetical protein